MRTTVGILTDEPVPGSTGQLDVLDCSAAVSSTSLCKVSEDPTKMESLSIVENPSLQLMETNEPMFSAFPIPFMENLNIGYKFDYTSDVTIQIFNLNGQLVKSYTESRKCEYDLHFGYRLRMKGQSDLYRQDDHRS